MELSSYLLGKKAGGGGSSDRDWSLIGFTKEPESIEKGYNHALEIKNNWVSTKKLKDVFSNDTYLMYAPTVELDESVTDASSGFAYCNSLIDVAPIDTSNIVNMSAMFMQCRALKNIPKLNTSNVTSVRNMFMTCTSIETLPLFDFSKVNNVWGVIQGCSNLKNLGGFKDLGKAYSTTDVENYSSYTLSLADSTKLTHDSLMNVINNLYDIASLGVQKQTLELGNKNKAKLTSEEIAIATNKGWNVI